MNGEPAAKAYVRRRYVIYLNSYLDDAFSGVDAAAEERRQREYSGKRERIDIRTIKREERIRRLANRPLESVLKSEKRSILNHLLDKMEATAEATEADLIEAEKEADRVEAAIKKEQPDILNTSSGKIFYCIADKIYTMDF